VRTSSGTDPGFTAGPGIWSADARPPRAAVLSSSSEPLPATGRRRSCEPLATASGFDQLPLVAFSDTRVPIGSAGGPYGAWGALCCSRAMAVRGCSDLTSLIASLQPAATFDHPGFGRGGPVLSDVERLGQRPASKLRPRDCEPKRASVAYWFFRAASEAEAGVASGSRALGRNL
jgi:hypothetical protein